MLSEKRAQEVEKEIKKNVDKENFIYIVEGKGQKNPLVSNDNIENRNINRRVDVEIFKNK